MRTGCLFALLFCLAATGAEAHSQNAGTPATPTLNVRSNLVEVPVLVKTKKGQVVFALRDRDFALTDDGVPQHTRLIPYTDSQPLALAVVVETGGDGADYLADYRSLGAIIDNFIGGVQHRVALVGFGEAPHLLVPFTPDSNRVEDALASLRPGGQGASILDSVAFAVALLRSQPPQYRRAILLLSETIDQGSMTSLGQALRMISDTNTTMYSFAFSSTRSAVGHEMANFNSSDPGPAHGCLSRQGAGAEYQGHYGKQVMNCISELAPPLRLATMAFLSARDSLRRDTAKSVARLTGGEFFHFRNAKTLQNQMIAAASDVHNYYVLSFTPTAPTPGPHVLHVSLPGRPKLRIQFRSEYWMDTEPQ